MFMRVSERICKIINFRCSVWWPAALSVSSKKKKNHFSFIFPHRLSPSIPLSRSLSLQKLWLCSGKVEQGQGKASSSEEAAAGHLDSVGHKTHRPWHIAGSLHARVATPSMHYYTGWTQCCKTEHRFMLSQRGECVHGQWPCKDAIDTMHGWVEITNSK